MYIFTKLEFPTILRITLTFTLSSVRPFTCNWATTEQVVSNDSSLVIVILHPVNNVAIKVFDYWNNVFTVLFNYQYCYYFLTGLKNNVMITIGNKLFISILFSIVPTTVNNCCCFINVEQRRWNDNEQHCSFNNIVQSAFICTTLNTSYISLQREWVTFLLFLYGTHLKKEAKSTLFNKKYFV